MIMIVFYFNQWFSGIFRGYKMGTLPRNGLKEAIRIFESLKKNYDEIIVWV